MFYNTKKTLNRIATIIAMGAIIAFIMPQKALTQGFANAGVFKNNTGGIYEAVEACATGGAIVMKGTATTDGSFDGMGRNGDALTATNPTGRIPGKVVWAKAGDQTIANTVTGITGTDLNRFYTNLYVAGTGEKIFHAANVSGIFDYWGTTTASITHHLCEGVFTYDGAGNPTAQNILGFKSTAGSGVTNSNHYAKLVINQTGTGTGANYPKALISSEVKALAVEITKGAVLVEAGGKLVLDNAPMHATCAIPPSYIDDTLRITDCGAELITVAGVVIEVRNGELVNDCDGPDCNTKFPDGTKVVYHPGKKIMQTWENCAYAEVVIYDPSCEYGLGGQLTLAGDIFVRQNFEVRNSAVLNTEDNTVWFIGPTAGMTFIRTTTQTPACADDALCGEVIGWIGRMNSPTDVNIAGFGNTTVAGPFGFHNTGTKLSFAGFSVPGNSLPGENMTKFRMRMLPLTTGTNLTNHAESKAQIEAGYGYINRLVEVEYDGTAGSITYMTVGYRADELMPGTNSPPLAENEFRNKLRGFEASLNASNAKNEMVLLGGTTVANPSMIPWGNASNLACSFEAKTQITPGISMLLNAAAGAGTSPSLPTASTEGWDIRSNNQIVFSDQPIWFRSVANGRWSNPATWNMGTTPTTTDHVELRHIVYTGFSDNTATFIFGQPQYRHPEATTMTSENQLPGTLLPCPKTGQINTLADTVRIVAHPSNTGGTGDSFGALVIGNNATAESNGSIAIATMNLAVPLRFNVIDNQVEGSNASVTAGGELGAIKSTSGPSPVDAYGVLITSCGSPNPGNTDGIGPVVNGVNILNSGRFTNRATLSVGIGNNDIP